MASSGSGPSPQNFPFPAANTLQFVHEFGTNNYEGDTITGLVTDPDGDILVAGYTAGNLPGYSVPDGVLKGALYAMDPSGNQLWAKELAQGSEAAFNGVAATPAGIFVLGDTRGAFAGASNPNGIDETFVAKYDTSGNQLWVKQYASLQDTLPETICADGNGNLIFAGEVDDSSGGQDMFVEEVDASGNELWEKTYGTDAVDSLSSVTVDASGDIYAVGATSGTFPGSHTSTLAQPFVLKLDGGTGATVWLQNFDGSTTPPIFYPSAIQAVPGGKLDIVGESVAQITNNFPTDIQMEVMQMDAETDSALWNIQFGAGNWNIPGQNLAVDTNGDIYVGGTTTGPVAPNVTADIFLAKISSSGSGIWAQRIGTGMDGPTIATSVSTPVYVSLANQSVFLGGMTAGQFQGFSNPNHDMELFLAKFGQ